MKNDKKQLSVLNTSSGSIQKYFSGSSLSDLSLRNYTGAVKKYLDYLNRTGQDENEISLSKYFKSLSSLAPSTLRLNLYAIKKYIFSKYGTDFEKRSKLEAVFKAPELKKAKVKTQKAITEDDYITKNEVFGIAKLAKSKRLSLIIQSLFWTGCRISELLNITLDRVKVNGKASIKVVGKGNKERTVFLPLVLYKEIIKEFKYTGAIDKEAEYLFPTRTGGKYHRVNISRDVKRLVNSCGYEIHTHTFRHSCAMYLKNERGLSADQISKYLGHASPAVTLEYYFHGTPSAEDIGIFEGGE